MKAEKLNRIEFGKGVTYFAFTDGSFKSLTMYRRTSYRNSYTRGHRGGVHTTYYVVLPEGVYVDTASGERINEWRRGDWRQFKRVVKYLLGFDVC